jgi:hypothetical protein
MLARETLGVRDHRHTVPYQGIDTGAVAGGSGTSASTAKDTRCRPAGGLPNVFPPALVRPPCGRSRLELAQMLGGRMRAIKCPACSVNTVQHPRLATTSAGLARFSCTTHVHGLCSVQRRCWACFPPSCGMLPSGRHRCSRLRVTRTDSAWLVRPVPEWHCPASPPTSMWIPSSAPHRALMDAAHTAPGRGVGHR